MPDRSRPTHPRPQLRRRDWTPLDGDWDFALDPEAVWERPADVRWSQTIRVPFAPETRASGISDTGFYSACWYRRVVTPRVSVPGKRLILHFGAVDYEATIWANGVPVAHHRGGYSPFSQI